MNNCMFCRILGLCLIIYTALCYTSEETPVIIQSNYNTKAVLPCHALSYSNHYTSITWYKVTPNEEGIIRKSVKQSEPQIYKNYENRTDVVLAENGSLVLQMVTFTQSGPYKCFLAGKVGNRNNESYVILNVTELVIKTTPTLEVTTNYVLHSTVVNSSLPDLVAPVDVSPLTALVGFFSLSLSKGLLCFMSVWGMAVFKERQRRKLWS